MTNNQKARVFMQRLKEGDVRCNIVSMMLSISFGISERDVIDRISKMAAET